MIFNVARLRSTTRDLGSRFRCLYSRFYVNKGTRPQSMSTFSSEQDYVICGAGSAGCVLANRLSADPGNSVLLLEAGPSDAWVFPIQMPAGLGMLMADTKYNWYYNSVPQKHLNNRSLYCPRGRVLGGTSSINGMVYMRGHAYDYDRWEREGAKGWSYADCLPYFKKAQRHELGPNEYRGGDGLLYTSKGKVSNPLLNAFLQAGEQAGYPFTEDMSGYKQEGFGLVDYTILKGRRVSTAKAYIRPVQKQRKERLRTETKALVTRVLFEGKKAVGVEYIKDGQIKMVKANKEVILSGGAINSPQLLLLSGIGDGDELKTHGIPVVCHLPGVGQNLQDHTQIILRQTCTKPISLTSLKPVLEQLSIGLQWLLTGTGVGSSIHLDAGAFLRSKEGIPHPNLQLHFLPTLMIDHGRVLTKQHGYQIHGTPLRPQSRGTIKLKSADPRDHPLIDFNYMSTEQDWEEIRAVFHLIQEIQRQKAFDEFRGEEFYPGQNAQSEKEVDEFIREKLETVYHATSSCKMGDSSDKMAVVDNEARIFGVKGLRVVDASIMPSVVSGNTNAPTIMIAEKVADHILGKNMLPKLNVPVYKTPEQGQR